MRNRSTQYAAVAAIIAFLLAGCSSRQPGDPIKPGMNVYTPAQDIELGRQAAAEIRKQVDVVDDQQLQGTFNGWASGWPSIRRPANFPTRSP